MKIRIIKRADREKVTAEIPAMSVRSKSVDARTAMTAAVNSWIDELRKKRDDERLLFQQLFKGEYSG